MEGMREGLSWGSILILAHDQILVIKVYQMRMTPTIGGQSWSSQHIRREPIIAPAVGGQSWSSQHIRSIRREPIITPAIGGQSASLAGETRNKDH